MKIKDRPLNMPCSDPEGCKHFKAEIQLNKRIAELEGLLTKERELRKEDVKFLMARLPSDELRRLLDTMEQDLKG